MCLTCNTYPRPSLGRPHTCTSYLYHIAREQPLPREGRLQRAPQLAAGCATRRLVLIGDDAHAARRQNRGQALQISCRVPRLNENFRKFRTNRSPRSLFCGEYHSGRAAVVWAAGRASPYGSLPQQLRTPTPPCARGGRRAARGGGAAAARAAAAYIRPASVKTILQQPAARLSGLLGCSSWRSRVYSGAPALAIWTLCGWLDAAVLPGGGRRRALRGGGQA